MTICENMGDAGPNTRTSVCFRKLFQTAFPLKPKGYDQFVGRVNTVNASQARNCYLSIISPKVAYEKFIQLVENEGLI